MVEKNYVIFIITFLTSSFLKGMVDRAVITEAQAVSLMIRLRRKFKSFDEEADINSKLQLGCKKCPGNGCGAWHMHYYNHGCHHIALRSPTTRIEGCTSCFRHFCYNCMYFDPDSDGKVWTGCANCLTAFCDDLCLCPICPDCTPGVSCAHCDTGVQGCPGCNPPAVDI